MTPRTPRRILLLTLGVLALGVVGAALLDSGSAEAAGPPPTPVVAIDGTAVTVGPLTVDTPVPLPVAQPIQVAVPVPPAVAATIASLPVAGAIVQTPIHVELPTLAELRSLPGLGALPVPGLPVDVPIAGTAGVHLAVSSPSPLVGADRLTDIPSLTRGGAAIAATVDIALRPILGAATPDAPTLPSLPWTLGFTGLLAAAFATAGTDGSGGKRTGDSPFLAVIAAGRHAVARLVTRLGPARPDASRPGFALLLGQPG